MSIKVIHPQIEEQAKSEPVHSSQRARFEDHADTDTPLVKVAGLGSDFELHHIHGRPSTLFWVEFGWGTTVHGRFVRDMGWFPNWQDKPGTGVLRQIMHQIADMANDQVDREMGWDAEGDAN